MTDDRNEATADRGFTRAAAIAAIVSAPLAIASVVTSLAAVRFDFAAMADPAMLLRAGHAAAGLWRASMLFDLFGYYLPIVPLVLVLRAAFRPRAGAWSELFGLSLLAYCLLGAAGAAMLTTAIPPLIEAYPAAGPDGRRVLEQVYAAQSDDVYVGMWNLLETFLGGLGWLGFGWLLRSRGRGVGVLTLALGLASLIDSLGTILNLEWLSLAGLNLYLVLAPTWALVMGVRLLRQPL
jgi:hypothetical protein